MRRTPKLLTLIFLCFFSVTVLCQELRLKKGIIVDSLRINDSIPDTYALFLPQSFEMKGKWPLLTVFDMNGQAKNGMSQFVAAANDFGYVVAASNAIHDSVSLSENIVRAKRLMDQLIKILPINTRRIYTAGIEDGGRFANLMPIFIKNIEGTLSIDASIANIELLNMKNQFKFIGVTDKGNFNFPTLLSDEKLLNTLKYPNALLMGSSKQDSRSIGLVRALSYFDLLAMGNGNMTKDSVLIDEMYQRDIEYIDLLITENKYLLANRAMAETMSVFRLFKDVDSLREEKRNLKRNKTFRTQKREEEAALFKETLLREDFAYYLEEDVLTYNFNNLGWWNYQKAQIDKYASGSTKAEKEMGQRLQGYINALIQDNIDLVRSQQVVDEEALVFLYMLKTIIEPENFDHYLKVASIASKNEDFGTALFYLEEALKKGLKSQEALYSIPHTALLRITPEFNALVKKYFKDARYKTTDQ